MSESDILLAWHADLRATTWTMTHPSRGGPHPGREAIDVMLADWAALCALAREAGVLLP